MRPIASIQRAMTVVELLTVVAVIALLLGLLMPSLRTARSAAHSLQCKSHLRQMVTAAISYTVDFNRFPDAIRYEMRDGALHQVSWDSVTTMSGEYVSTGPLWDYVDQAVVVHQCPVYFGDPNFPGDETSGYNYNTSFIGDEFVFAPPSFDFVRRGVRIGQHRRTTTTAIFGDGGYVSGASKFMRAPLDENIDLYTRYAGGQAFRHNGMTNFACLDGHIDSTAHTCPGDSATDTLLSTVMGYPSNAFLSDDNSIYDPR